MAYDHKLNKYEDDVFTPEEFNSACEYGMFTDDDGYGCPVKDGLFDMSITISPSNRHRTFPANATHIVWFNR